MITPDRPRNRLLSALSPQSWIRIRPCLELVPLKPKRILHHARLPIDQVYFIETGLVSVPVPTDRDNLSAEGWVIGPEGFAGVPVALGAVTSPYRRIVQVGGSAWAMKSGDLIQAMEALPEFRWLVLGYVHSVLVQTAQSSACHARHPLKGRVARHLLMAQDRLEMPEIALTHDALAKMLGVRRASITTALHELAEARAIRVARNRITIVNRALLESLTCYCYTVIRNAFQRPRTDQPPEAHPTS